MNAAQKRRLGLAAAVSVGVAAGVALMLYAFQQNLMYFHSPSQVAAGVVETDVPFRLGGLVAEGSVQTATGSMEVRFALTDGAHSIPVRYHGLLPDLFREGQGVVVLGRLDAGRVFEAQEVLAKHDENYMPPEVAQALDEVEPHPIGVSR